MVVLLIKLFLFMPCPVVLVILIMHSYCDSMIYQLIVKNGGNFLSPIFIFYFCSSFHLSVTECNCSSGLIMALAQQK